MVTTIKFGGYQGDKSVHTRAGRVFCQTMPREVGEAAEVIFDQNIVEQGHKASDLLVRTENGELDGCYFSSSYLAHRVPELGLFDQHFVVPSRKHAYAVLDGELGQRLAQEVEKQTGFAVLGYWDNGLRNISSGRGALRNPQDCKNLKIRTLANEDHKRVFRALGFEPLSIDVRDLPEAVRNFQVDAQENPLTNIYNFDLHKTHRHITMTRHLLGVALVLFNKAIVASWPSPIRRAVKSAMKEATMAQRQFAQEDDIVCAQSLQADGVELVELTDAQRAKFIAATKDEIAITRAAFDDEMIDLFEKDIAGVGV